MIKSFAITTQLNTMKMLLKIKIPKLCTPCVCKFASLVYHYFLVYFGQWNFSTAWLHLPLWFILQYCLEIQLLVCWFQLNSSVSSRYWFAMRSKKYKAIKANLNNTTQEIIEW